MTKGLAERLKIEMQSLMDEESSLQDIKLNIISPPERKFLHFQEEHFPTLSG